MQAQARSEDSDHFAAAARRAVLGTLEQGGASVARAEAKVHRALDLLRGGEGDPERLRRLATLSCLLARLPCYRRQGRINACASTLLRLAREADRL